MGNPWHQQRPLWQPPDDPGPTGSCGGGEGGGWQPDDRLLLHRPHPWQPPCLLAGLTPGSPQFKPMPCSATNLVTSHAQVLGKPWILLGRDGKQCTSLNKPR